MSGGSDQVIYLEWMGKIRWRLCKTAWRTRPCSFHYEVRDDVMTFAPLPPHTQGPDSPHINIPSN